MGIEFPDLKHDLLTVAVNTIYTGITTQCGSEFIETIRKNYIDDNNLYFIFLIQIFMSWVYLGIFISSLYQKLRQE